MCFFFDFNKAFFNMVSRNILNKILERFRCPLKFLKMVKGHHDGMKGRVLLSGNLSEGFNVGKGVKQGDPLATTLFTVFLMTIPKVMK